MTCPKCGKEADGKFCLYCGANLEETAAAPVAPAQPAQPQSGGFQQASQPQQPAPQQGFQQAPPQQNFQQAPQQPYQQQQSSQQPYQQPTIVINNANANTNTNNNGMGGYGISPKSKTTALLLCFFLGSFGAHRFYVGKAGTGILWLLTLGFCGVGTIIDFIMLLLGSFKDGAGFPIKN